MQNTILWMLFVAVIYVIFGYVMPAAIDKEFAIQDAIIEQHIANTHPSNNPYK